MLYWYRILHSGPCALALVIYLWFLMLGEYNTLVLSPLMRRVYGTACLRTSVILLIFTLLQLTPTVFQILLLLDLVLELFCLTLHLLPWSPECFFFTSGSVLRLCF